MKYRYNAISSWCFSLFDYLEKDPTKFKFASKIFSTDRKMWLDNLIGMRLNHHENEAY